MSEYLSSKQPMPTLLTSKEAAAYLGVGAETLYIYIKQGRLKGYKLGGIGKRRRWRFLITDIDAFVMSSAKLWYHDLYQENDPK